MPRHATLRGSLIQDIDHELKSVPDFDYCMSRVSKLNAKLKHLVRRVDKLKRKTDKLVFGHAKHFEKFQKANDKVIEYWNALGDLRTTVKQVIGEGDLSRGFRLQINSCEMLLGGRFFCKIKRMYKSQLVILRASPRAKLQVPEKFDSGLIARVGPPPGGQIPVLKIFQ